MTGSQQLLVATGHDDPAKPAREPAVGGGVGLTALDGQTNPHVEDSGYAELVALREFGKNLTDNPRVARCGHKIRRGAVGGAGEVLETTIYCGHVWLCPTCAAHRAWEQSGLLGAILTAWTSGDGMAAMLTLTQTHSLDDALHDLWRRLDVGWAALQRGSGWGADRRQFGIRHYVRITEVVHHVDTGWNVHFHVLVLLDQLADDHDLYGLKDRLVTRFIRGVRAAGGQARLAGQDLQPVRTGAEQRVAAYCTKGPRALWSANSRTPMAILAGLRHTGEGIDLIEEFNAAVTLDKHRRYSPSRGIVSLVPDSKTGRLAQRADIHPVGDWARLHRAIS